MNDPLSLILPHDTVWAMYEPAARQLRQMVSQMDMAAHLRDVASLPTSESHRYFEAFAGAKDDALRVSVDGDEEVVKPYQMDGSVAVLTLSGALTKAGTSMSRGGSMVYAGRMVDLAARDKDVSAIVLRVDSPGGSVSGTQALAQRVSAAAKSKPVIAVVEDLCASAAYWIASGATQIVANPTALIGSIGTYMAVVDSSRAAANAGCDVHVISTGPNKGAGVPGSPITPAQLAAWQDMIDGVNQHFLTAVSENRGIAPGALAGIADGRVYLAADALSMGLIDGIGSYETALSQITKENSMKLLDKVKAALAGTSPSQETTETAEAIAAAADTELAAQAAAHTQALADRDAAQKAKDAEISRLTALAAKAQAEAEALKAAQADAQAEAEEAEAQENEDAISALVADFKITPAASEHAIALRAAAPEAFDAVFAEIKPLASVAGTAPRKTTTRAGSKSESSKSAADVAAALAGGQTPADQLHVAAEAILAASPKLPYHVAFSQACAENPDLAKAHVGL